MQNSYRANNDPVKAGVPSGVVKGAANFVPVSGYSNKGPVLNDMQEGKPKPYADMVINNMHNIICTICTV